MGTPQLKTGTVRERTKVDKLSIEYPVSLLNDQDAHFEIIDNFMSELFNGNEQMVRYMQALLGYYLTGHTSERSLFIWWGL
jgi:phage/plasmid-associated DNA primase